MRWFLGGMMALQRELALFVAPNVNSYKRYAVASWAPVNVVWGRDNRTTGFRIVGHGAGLHIENRFPGGDMNAYLAYAAQVGAGLYGIEQQDRAAGGVQGQRLRGHRLRPHAALAGGGDRPAGGQQGRRGDPGPGRRGPLPQRGPRGAGHATTPRSTPGTASATSSEARDRPTRRPARGARREARGIWTDSNPRSTGPDAASRTGPKSAAGHLPDPHPAAPAHPTGRGSAQNGLQRTAVAPVRLSDMDSCYPGLQMAKSRPWPRRNRPAPRGARQTGAGPSAGRGLEHNGPGPRLDGRTRDRAR